MINSDSLKQINIIKQTDRQKISLVEDTEGKKFLMRELTDDKREIYKTLQKINHPNIPKIFYVDFADKTVVIEEYIDGIPLSRKNVSDKQQIKHIANAILSALETLHKANIIHRDIKPDNILINESGQVWLVDYEIARINRNEIRRDTEQIGTFGYAPIEQFGMLPTDFKTDIYAFGVTLSNLLDLAGIKGNLKRIADKCKRLDPMQRYTSATAVKKALRFSTWQLPLFILIVLVVATMAIALSLTAGKNVTSNIISENKVIQQKEKKETDKIPETKSVEITQALEKKETDKTPETSSTETTPTLEKQKETEQFEGNFSGFKMGETEKIHSEKNSLPNFSIFTTDTPYTHILFLEDMTKTGKIKFGEKIVDAVITLNNGTLSVTLSEEERNIFSHDFKYRGQFDYDMEFTNNLRKNADIICYDLDGDGDKELLIGLNECEADSIYNRVNYCIAWCIKYDESNGFTLCEGDMFSKGAPFSITQYGTGLNVRWENFGDVFGYYLDGNNILPY